MARAKHFEFPAGVEWEGGSITVASVAGKQDLDVATPPEFGGEAEGTWSPEDLLVASAATCFAVTLAAIVRHRTIPLLSLHVDGIGHVGARDDGRLGFTSIELEVTAETDSAGCRHPARGGDRARRDRLPRRDGPRHPRQCPGSRHGRLRERSDRGVRRPVSRLATG